MKNMTLEITDVESDGTYVIETGRATADIQPAGQEAAKPESYKYVVVWKKQKDGSWKIIRDIYNSGPATATPAAHH
jgi:ketosteroid isomerase-like protein